MRVTKKDLENRLRICNTEIKRLGDSNQLLREKLSFLEKLIPNQSMIVAMEKVTECLTRTLESVIRNERR